jgi:GlpG protein
MRQVGTLPNELQARRFVDYLTTQEIESRAEEDGDAWVIWVLDEGRVQQALGEYKDFRGNPDDPRYARVSGEAERMRRERVEKQRAAAKNVVEMRGNWRSGTARKAPVTFMLIAAAILVFFLTGMGDNWFSPTGRELLFTRPQQVGTDVYTNTDAFHQIKQGEVWRLVTPIFIHGDVWHILFNCYMLYYFGGQMETRRRWWRFLIFILLAAAFSNTAQAMIEGPIFGGFSGVVYALFGYIWMQAHFLPKSGFQISQLTVIILVGWFFACFTGWMGDIANTAHGAGLFFGIVIGYLPVLFPSLEGKV